jgi:hypothetical protein
VNAVMQALLRMPKGILKLSTPIENLQVALLNPAANRMEFMHAASVAFFVDVVSKMLDDNGNQLFRLGIQSDPGEFLITLIAHHIEKEYPHLVPDLAVTRTSRLTCGNCSTSSEILPDTANMLFVDLPEELQRSRNRNAKVHTTPVLQLQELVNVCVQQKGKDIEFKCPSCEHKGPCATSSQVETGPVLVMCLKRFQQSSKNATQKSLNEKKSKKEKKKVGVKVSKTHQMVEVPLELHLPTSNEVYSLVNIVCHHGKSRAYGHCIAHCRIKESGQFQTFDDHNAKKADDRFRFSKEAYLVTYVWQSILQKQVRLIFNPLYFLPFLYLFLFTTSLF